MARDDDSLAHFFGGQTAAPTKLGENPAAAPEAVLGTEVDDDSADGEVAVDVYQTDTHVVVVSPIAGINPDAIEISATEDSVTISGERKGEHLQRGENVITQEIFWGAFSRTVELPAPCEVDHATAAFKHGILTVKIPKSGKARKKTIKVKSDE